MDAFVTRLRTLAKTCQFDTSLDEMIRDQVIEKCASNALRRRLLREQELTLNNLLSIARSFELADRQALEIEQKFESSTHLNSIERNRDFQQPRRNSAKRHRAKDVQCPALDKTCRRCGKSGHFARVCRQKTNKPKQYKENARQLEQSDDDSSENECLFTLTAHNVHHRSDSLHMLEIEHIPVQMLIDSGASVNVLDLETYHRLKARKGVQLMPSTLRVYAYGSTTPLNILGTVSGRVKCNCAEIVAKFVVVHDQHAGCLLGRQTATQLGLLRVGPQVSSINCAVSPYSLRQRYPSVFDGVGKLTNYQQKISINTNIKPVAQPPRRIPFHVRKQVSAKLEELERLDIIEEVRGPTPWVSPLVVVPKSSGEIRVCVDMRQRIHQSVVSGNWPKTKETDPYFCVKNELTATESLLLRGSRIVVPASLQPTTLQLAHEGHQEIVRTKQLLREKVWWPGIDKDVEHLIRSCISCQAQSSQSRPQPLTMTEMPSRPWTVLHADLCGPFPSGESLLVLVDSCSRWPEVFILKSTTAAVIINRMKSCFAVHGLPEAIVTDNGPQFVAEEFDLYLREHGITHRRVTPYWPQANSEVERFNRTLEKAIRAANTEGKDWKSELNTFLLNYRATAHCTTGKSPAVLLFGREIRTKLPSLNTSRSPASTSPVVDPAILERDRCQKAKMKKYADKKRRAAPSNIKRGDKVLLTQERKNKLSTKYDPDPYI
ncbi:Transposon Tf2-6 poly, partial [Paramuricea clavata]